MGWTCMRTHDGFDRKAFCDSLAGWEAGDGTLYRVKKSATVGGTYYAAVEQTTRQKVENGEEGQVFCAVILTQASRGEFCYKCLSENSFPAKEDCPPSILRLLGETDNEDALRWRERCWENALNKKPKPDFKIGQVVAFADCLKVNGKAIGTAKITDKLKASFVFVSSSGTIFHCSVRALNDYIKHGKARFIEQEPPAQQSLLSA